MSQTPSERLIENYKCKEVDIDTTIKSKKIITLGQYAAIHEKWRWDGVLGESIIFDLDGLENISDQEFVNLLVECKVIASKEVQHTTKRTEDGFLFINFNFVVC